ncbi:MAG: hypothetical protein U0V02_21005 [Anaerolineales bacterium]
MQKNINRPWHIEDTPISLLILIFLLSYTYGIFVHAPYIGFYFNPADGKVFEMYVSGGVSLREGDTLLQVGKVTLDEYRENRRLVLFPNKAQKGNIVPITILRNGVESTVNWKIPGFTLEEFFGRFFNIWWLAYFFWVFGSITEIFIRPKEIHWWLLIAFNHLTSLWLIFGSLSAWQLWGSSILLHSITWMLLPIYLHLHWIFPRPLASLPKSAAILLYSASIIMSIMELFQILPKYFYALALLLALVGSIILQISHYIWRSKQRRQISILAIATLLATLPSISISIAKISGVVSQIGPISLLALPFIPLTYFYLIFRNQLGGLEMRAHRVISIYAYLIITGTIIIFLLTISLRLPEATSTLMTILIPLLASALSISIYPNFQAFVEKHFLGIKLPYQNLQETYSNHIAINTSINDLLQFLSEEVFPSLLVRQFAFMQVFNGKLKALLTKNLTPEQIPHANDIHKLTALDGTNDLPNGNWIRLILPLKAGDTFIGFWLLGRRDPDDHYSQVEIPILQSIANQTAIALSNILHTEQVRMLFELDVERYEQERLSLALDLHDSVLNQLAVFRNNFGETVLSPKLQSSYEEITRRLREIVSELRPPMLIYGLKPAITELADNLMERSGDKTKIKIDLEASGGRIPAHIEQHLFRIVQEACENSLRHAEAKSISIYGTLTSEKVDLNIQDDGKGFDADSKLELDNLLANRHFGLSGMVERAALIKATIKIHSSLNTGTRIHLTWNNEF